MHTPLWPWPTYCLSAGTFWYNIVPGAYSLLDLATRHPDEHLRSLLDINSTGCEGTLRYPETSGLADGDLQVRGRLQLERHGTELLARSALAGTARLARGLLLGHEVLQPVRRRAIGSRSAVLNIKLLLNMVLMFLLRVSVKLR
jgi:hypothetical protein